MLRYGYAKDWSRLWPPRKSGSGSQFPSRWPKWTPPWPIPRAPLFRAGRMKLPDLDNGEFIPLPPEPPAAPANPMS